MNSNYTYCDLNDFSHSYKYVHGYLTLLVCIFGSLMNVFNICVLRTKQMRSPTNSILTGLAVSDLLVMMEYIPFTVHRSISPHRFYASHFSYPWAAFYKSHVLLSIIFHFISCCLTIILAIWRYVYVSKLQGHTICASQRKTDIAIVLTYLICPFVCIPVFDTLEIRAINQRTHMETGLMVLNHQVDNYNKSLLINTTIYLLTPNNSLLGIWIYSLLLKLIPCILLSALSYKIISVLLETKRRRIKLRSSCTPLDEISGKNKQNAIQLYKENQADRTTKMLLAVLLLFLITEIPQAVLGQLIVVYGQTFFKECYANLGDVMDLMTLTNSAITFILYCAMSRQFRVTFQEIFKLKLLVRWLPVNQEVPQDTTAETKMSLV